MNTKTWKPGDVARILGVTGMTLRNYVRNFSESLSPSATASTGRRFTAEDIETLKFAASLLRDGFNYAQTATQVEQREQQPTPVEVLEGIPEEPETEPMPEPEPESAIVTIEFINRFLDQLQQEHQTALGAKDEYIQELLRDKERLQQEKEQAQRENEYLRLPWYRRIFRRKE